MTNNTIFDGEVGVGTNDITSPLNIGGTGCMIIPSGTTGQRPTAVTGKIRFNTTIHKFEGRASDWHPLSDEDLPPLYAFTSHTFTNGGQTGRTGPSLSQLRTAYASESWELNTNFFNIKAGSYTGFQLWTVPVTGTYSIEAKGASGGFGDTTSKLPGRGAHIKANFVLTKSTKIVIIVGQAGSSQTGRTNNVGGGGGGATWVLKDVANAPFASLNDVYMAAGGGAGGHAYTGTISRTADANGGSNASASSSSGGAAAANATYNPGGGAGYGGTGAGSTTSNPSGGQRPTDSATGGYSGYQNDGSSYNGRHGGFGGGGGNGAHSSGGGGGYQGGQAQYWATNTVAAASTSHISPSGDIAAVSGSMVFSGNHSGVHGSVLITKL